MVDTGYLTAEHLSAISARGAIGDMLGRYFDADGDPVDTGWEGRVIGATIDQLHAIDNVVIVAAGADKAEAAMGAVRTGAVNTLVVDSELAGALWTASKDQAERTPERTDP
jgi:DNA-binding transcriptional regulator LsrR (DeoR family)